MYVYKCGVIVGRFQLLHRGHAQMIADALSICEHLIIFIGSAQESRTRKNPLTFEERAKVIESAFWSARYDNRISILPLPDAGVGNNSAWGDYVMAHVPVEWRGKIDLIISAKESRRNSWFDNYPVAELFMPKYINISATEMRDFLHNDDRESFEKYYVGTACYPYDRLRKIVLESWGNTDTQSV